MICVFVFPNKKGFNFNNFNNVSKLTYTKKCKDTFLSAMFLNKPAISGFEAKEIF